MTGRTPLDLPAGPLVALLQSAHSLVRVLAEFAPPSDNVVAAHAEYMRRVAAATWDDPNLPVPAIEPELTYHTWADRDGDYDPAGIAFTSYWGSQIVPLYDIHDVNFRRDPDGVLIGTVRGRMLTKAGHAGPSRGNYLDLAARQPTWMATIILDAERRLARQVPRR